MKQVVLDTEALKKGIESGLAAQGEFCRRLEEGSILFFPASPVLPDEKTREFLLNLRQVDASYHKNIAYRPHQHRVTGVVKSDSQTKERLLEIMSEYTRSVCEFLGRLLPQYSETWHVDYGSFRPQEEKGRKIKETSRNDLLHVDAFPTRPTHGSRILRFFTNVNPNESRLWLTADPFEQLLEKFGDDCGFLPGRESSLKKAGRAVKSLCRSVGLPVTDRSRYDEFMLAFHDYLKLNRDFQEDRSHYEWEFPPNSSWMVYTDLVPHAARSGRFALEQTLIISKDSLLIPERSPLKVLERKAGFELA